MLLQRCIIFFTHILPCFHFRTYSWSWEITVQLQKVFTSLFGTTDTILSLTQYKVPTEPKSCVTNNSSLCLMLCGVVLFQNTEHGLFLFIHLYLSTCVLKGKHLSALSAAAMFFVKRCLQTQHYKGTMKMGGGFILKVCIMHTSCNQGLGFLNLYKKGACHIFYSYVCGWQSQQRKTNTTQLFERNTNPLNLMGSSMEGSRFYQRKWETCFACFCRHNLKRWGFHLCLIC